MNLITTLLTLSLLTVLIINATPSNFSGTVQSSGQNDENSDNDNERINCSVCLEREPDTIIGLCGHWFCRECIIRLQENQPYKCPLCRLRYWHENPDASCAVCYDAVPDTVIGLCGHWFCSTCILRLQETQPYKCPFCRAQYWSDYPNVRNPNPAQNHYPEPDAVDNTDAPSVSNSESDSNDIADEAYAVDNMDGDNLYDTMPTTLNDGQRIIQSPDELINSEEYLRERLVYGYRLNEINRIVENLRDINFDSSNHDGTLILRIEAALGSNYNQYQAGEIISYLRENENQIRRNRERLNQIQAQREVQARERGNEATTQQPHRSSRRQR